MKTYKYKINGTQYEVEILSVEGNLAKIEVNGTPYDVEIDREIKQKTPRLVRTDSVTTSQSTPATARTSKPVASAGEAPIKSPLPGVILDVHVKVGDKVKMGQKLMMLEAMKMENNIDSHKDGTVASIKVSKGDSVMEGDVLLIIGD